MIELTTDSEWTKSDNYYMTWTSGSADTVPMDDPDENYESYIKTRQTIKGLMLGHRKLNIPKQMPMKKWVLPRKQM